MKIKWISILLLACGSAMAQTVFNKGVDVKGRAVQGVGLIDMANTNLSWGSMVPSLAQLAGLDPANGASLGSVFLVPLRPAWLETDGIYARTSNGLTFFDENGSAVLRIRAGTVWSAGDANSNLTLNARAITGGRLAAAVLPSGGTWDAGGLTLSNVTLSGNGAGLRGISAQHIVGLGSAAQRSASTFAMAEQGSLAETALQPDSYAPNLGASITTNYVTDTNTIIVTGTGFPGTLTYRNESDGQYYYLAGSPDLLLNMAWTNQPQSATGDYWARINGTWYLVYTCSGSPNSPTGTLTAVNTIYLQGSGTAADAAYPWDNTGSVWTNGTGYWIATNATAQVNELWGPSGNTNTLLATSATLSGNWTTQETNTVNFYGTCWGSPMPLTWNSSSNRYEWSSWGATWWLDGTGYYYDANAEIPSGCLLATPNAALIGSYTAQNKCYVINDDSGFNGCYTWSDNDQRWNQDGGSNYIWYDDGTYKMCNSNGDVYYTASTLDAWDNGHVENWTPQSTASNAYSRWVSPDNIQSSGTNYSEYYGTSTFATSFYPAQTNGVAQFSDVSFNTNKLSYVSGLAISALQPGESLTNLTGQLLVTALPTGAGKTWNTDGLTLSNVTISGNGMGLTNVLGSAIVGLSASQITSGLLNPALFSTNGIWDVGGLVLTNVTFAAGTISTPTLAQVLAAGNDGDGQALTNVMLRGEITVETGNITNLNVYGSTILHYVPAQGDIAMGSYTNQP